MTDFFQKGRQFTYTYFSDQRLQVFFKFFKCRLSKSNSLAVHSQIGIVLLIKLSTKTVFDLLK